MLFIDCTSVNLYVMPDAGKEEVVAPRKNVHTVPSGNGWANKVGGEIVSNHHLKENAVSRGRQIARRHESEHLIHIRSGQIARRNSYGNDPNPPRDANR